MGADLQGLGFKVEVKHYNKDVWTDSKCTGYCDDCSFIDIHPDVQQKVAAVWEDCLGCMDDCPFSALVR